MHLQTEGVSVGVGLQTSFEKRTLQFPPFFFKERRQSYFGVDDSYERIRSVLCYLTSSCFMLVSSYHYSVTGFTVFWWTQRKNLPLSIRSVNQKHTQGKVR